MNCFFCKTGVYEIIGEINMENLQFEFTKFSTNDDTVKIEICSNPLCNHIRLVGGKNTLYNIRHNSNLKKNNEILINN